MLRRERQFVVSKRCQRAGSKMHLPCTSHLPSEARSIGLTTCRSYQSRPIPVALLITFYSGLNRYLRKQIGIKAFQRGRASRTHLKMLNVANVEKVVWRWRFQLRLARNNMRFSQTIGYKRSVPDGSAHEPTLKCLAHPDLPGWAASRPPVEWLFERMPFRVMKI